jgi:hypothetical protein
MPRAQLLQPLELTSQLAHDLRPGGVASRALQQSLRGGRHVRSKYDELPSHPDMTKGGGSRSLRQGGPPWQWT